MRPELMQRRMAYGPPVQALAGLLHHCLLESGCSSSSGSCPACLYLGSGQLPCGPWPEWRGLASCLVYLGPILPSGPIDLGPLSPLCGTCLQPPCL